MTLWRQRCSVPLSIPDIHPSAQMLRKALLAFRLDQSICSVAAPIAAKLFGLTLLLRADEVLQLIDKGVFA